MCTRLLARCVMDGVHCPGKSGTIKKVRNFVSGQGNYMCHHVSFECVIVVTLFQSSSVRSYFGLFELDFLLFILLF